MITVTEIAENHWDIYCSEQQEWEDIKKIVFYALEHYDETDLDYHLPRDRENGIECLDVMKALVEELKTMPESPEKISTRNLSAIRITVTDMADFSFSKNESIEGLDYERLEYLSDELYGMRETNKEEKNNA